MLPLGQCKSPLEDSMLCPALFVVQKMLSEKTCETDVVHTLKDDDLLFIQRGGGKYIMGREVGG